MDKSISPRTFYNQSSKASTSSAKTNTAATANLSQQCKLVGVRKVLKKVDSHLSSTLDEYKHGIENPLIKSLMTSNPALLAQCLAYRYYLKGRPCGDYVLSLYLQGQQSESRSRKRGNTTHNKKAFDHINDGDRMMKRFKLTQPNIRGQEVKEEYPMYTKDVVEMEGDSESQAVHQDIISEEESMYLNDVLSELQSLRKRHNESSSFSAAMPDKPRHAPPTNQASNTPYELEYESKPTINMECDGGGDDLIWLTKKMEKEWVRFLDLSGPAVNISDLCEQFPPSPDRQKTNHCYKAYISIGRRNQCDLGYFRTSDEAAKVFDMYAVGRRTLGKIVMKELGLRKRVKVRGLIHQLVSCFLNFI